MKRKIILFASMLVLGHWDGFAVPDFSIEPATAVQNGQLRISFTLNEYSDVSVWIEDTAGQPLRHLASGVLGPNPPAPLTAGSLSQTVVWDMRDDQGVMVTVPCRVKVGVGLQAGLDRFYGDTPNNELGHSSGMPKALGVDSLGNVYVKTSGWRGNGGLYMFNRAGQYVRTLEPIPGHLSFDQVKGIGVINSGNGKWLPMIYNAQHGTTLPEFNGRRGVKNIAVSPQGWLVMANGRDPFYAGFKTRRLLILKPDGSCPRDSIFGPVITPSPYYGNVTVAVSPDGRYAYAVGLLNNYNYDNSGVNHQVVYRALLDSKNLMQPFLGTLDSAGSDSSHFRSPVGIDVDAQGRLYVADSGNHRVMIFDTNKTVVGVIPCPSPFAVQVNPRTGNVYVLSFAVPKRLIKYGPGPSHDSVAALTLAAPSTFALDYRAAVPLLWYIETGYNSGVMHQAADSGSKIVPTGVRFGQDIAGTFQLPDHTAGFEPPGYIAVDPQERVLWAGTGAWARIDPATGVVTRTSLKSNELAFGPDGCLYSWSRNVVLSDTVVSKYDYNGNPVNFPNGTNRMIVTTSYFSGPSVGGRGICIGDDGDLYVAAVGHGAATLRRYGQDGTLKHDNLLVVYDSVWGGGGGFEVDRQGNIYMVASVRPKGVKFPNWVTGSQFPDPEVSSWRWPYAESVNPYSFNFGSFFKFPPTGGSIRRSGPGSAAPTCALGGAICTVQVCASYQLAFTVRGALTQYFGISPSPTTLSNNGGDPSCNCFTPRFTVDRLGRAFVPEAMQSKITVLDNNGNVMLRFGDYGNRDQTGLGGALPSPDIPLAYPHYVKVVKNHVYISDLGNHRIVRCNLGYAALWTSDGTVVHSSADNTPGSAAKNLRLHAYPNPLNAGARLALELPERARISVAIFDTRGRLVRRLAGGDYQAGFYGFPWDGRDSRHRAVAAGLYVACMKAGKRTLYQDLAVVR